MAQQVYPLPDEKEPPAWRRWLLAGATAAAVFAVLRWSVAFTKDRDAPERLLLQLYRWLGLENAALALQQNGMNPLAAKGLLTLVALLTGVLGVWAVYWVLNLVVDGLPGRWERRLRPFVFVSPSLLLLGTFLIYPAFNTIYTSLSEDITGLPTEVPAQFWASDTIAADYAAAVDGLSFGSYWLNTDQFELARATLAQGEESESLWLLIRPDTVEDETGGSQRIFTLTTLGLQNYRFVFTSPDMRIAFRNNFLWLLLGTGGSVILGLIVATLVDRVRWEPLAKSLIFLPQAISFVGASVIWRFVYAWQPPAREQIGLLNAIVTSLGGEPVPWLIEPPINTYALIVIMIWLQAGFAMVILSAALKAVDHDLVEAARIDGANEWQIFFRIILPLIRGAILTVTTAIFIAVLKVFDIVYVMTSGKFDTEVVANRMFVEMFTFRNFGRASALAVLLLVGVLPLMVLNIRNLRRQGISQVRRA